MINKNKIITILIVFFLSINLSYAWYTFSKTIIDKGWNTVLLEAMTSGRITGLTDQLQEIRTIYQELARDIYDDPDGYYYKTWDYTVWCTNGYQVTLIPCVPNYESPIVSADNHCHIRGSLRGTFGSELV